MRNADRRPQGASTITQQVARNFLLSSEVKFSRKIREMVLAMRIDNAFSKNRILELYLNEIFLGENSYGVAAAATNYFGKPLDELIDIPDRRSSPGLPKGSGQLQPDAAQGSRDGAPQLCARSDVGEWLHHARAKRRRRGRRSRHLQPADSVQSSPDVDYFVEEVRRTLQQKYGDKSLYDGGLQVRSTLDPRLQDIAVRSLRAGLIAYDRRHGWRAPIGHVDMGGNWQSALSRHAEQIRRTDLESRDRHRARPGCKTRVAGWQLRAKFLPPNFPGRISG